MSIDIHKYGFGAIFMDIIVVCVYIYIHIYVYTTTMKGSMMYQSTEITSFFGDVHDFIHRDCMPGMGYYRPWGYE